MTPPDRGRLGDRELVRFGKNLLELRREAGLSQSELAERAGMRTTDISTLERGIREPRLETLVRLAGGLGQPIDRLFEGLK